MAEALVGTGTIDDAIPQVADAVMDRALGRMSQDEPHTHDGADLAVCQQRQLLFVDGTLPDSVF